ncbi:mitochondrial folate transporter/carrier isoform X2 [Aphidius gifuensis]|uniref:mitochondrial folate transporter/carrier isoform X2 n=1 Tax=Aphidius gifuensis TaxID=684658 RepID=UPI001CDD6F21|nr:mitochondrial folate transporter/carrier isoform X2 [Aphidius gifuensis]
MIKIDHNTNDDDSVNKLFKLSTITKIIEAKTRGQDKDNNMTTTGRRPFFIPFFSHFKYEPFVAGISGGVVSTLMLHPLDLMKIRFAVNDGLTKTAPQYSSLTNAVKDIVRTEGIRGLYRGVVTNVLGSGSSWGFYFFFYESMKAWIQDGDPSKSLSPTLHLLAAADAGLLSLLLTNPLWVVKTRLCLQYANDVNISESKRYSGMNDAFRKIWRTEGIRGLYKGIVPGMFGVSHGAIQFMIYEEMKKGYNVYKDKPFNTKPEFLENIGLAASSKFIAAASTYPYQVVRARLQDHHHDYRGTWHCVQSTFRSEGIKGFYKGLTPYLLHVTPNICFILIVYENFPRLFR